MDQHFADVPAACAELERWRSRSLGVLGDFAALLDLRPGNVRARITTRDEWISRLASRGADDAIARLRQRDDSDLLVMIFDHDGSGAMPLDELQSSVALMQTEVING